ncbi:MAG: hypothetical protein ACYDHN_10980 [Solirubrobacteraceae bacterium]
MRWVALALAALTLTGCETTQEKAAKLEAIAKRHEREASKNGATAKRGLAIAHQSTKVKVTATALLRSSEGAAAVVTLHNASATPLRNVPIAITIRSAAGTAVYSNDEPGLAAALVSVPQLPAHGQTTWIDDQIQASGAPASVDVKVGEGEALGTGAIPRLSVEGEHVFEDPTNGTGVEGAIVNHSTVSQQELVVYAIARRAGKIVAAGRAIVAQAQAGSSTRFQIFCIGDPRGAKLSVTAPPTTFG